MVVGLGYVGLPLVVAASNSGIQITGLDKNPKIVSDLNRGVSHIDDLSNQDIQDLLKTGFQATTDPEAIGESDYVIICVPTPLDESGKPDLKFVLGATEDIAKYAHSNLTVILESTTYPGTTEEIVKPIIEATGLKVGENIHLAFSPERIDPGNEIYGITNTPKIVGGVTAKCTESATQFYEQFIKTVIRAKGPKEAETAKLLENTYRHINIALVNEMAQFAHAMNIDIWDVVALAKTKPFGFQSFSPSAGVGGHCIPIDPNYLAYKVRADLERPFRFVELAEEINNSMPGYVTRRAQDLLNAEKKPISGSKICLLGVTYKANIADKRESPAVPLAEKLMALGADLSYLDPFVPEWHINGNSIPRITNLEIALTSSDANIVVQSHQNYISDTLFLRADIPPVLDTTGKLSGPNIERL